MVEPIAALDLFFGMLGLVVLVILTRGFQRWVTSKDGDRFDY